MATSTVKTESCRHCGADIREGSAFCYNCGKELFPQSARNGSSETKVKAPEVAPTTLATEPKANALNGGLEKKERLRRPARKEPEVVEIVWARPAAPSPVFYIASVVLAGLAIFLILLALYLR